MDDPRLSFLEDSVWDYMGKDGEPRFLFLGQSPLLQEAFLRLIPISRPYFGRARFCVPPRFEHTFASVTKRFDRAVSQGLVTVETKPEESVEGAIVITDDADLAKNVKDPKCVFALNELQYQEPPVDDEYRYTVAFLSLYGKPLSEFRLPTLPSDDVLSRDWHYLGPAKTLKAYDRAKDEIRLAFKKNNGSLCPRESFDPILRALRGEEIEGERLYRAIASCYQVPCILRDMAAYQHETWMLRTLAFSPNPKAKESMLVPYPTLLSSAYTALANKKSVEETFAADILYSDFLVPLLYLRRLLAAQKN